ncbi:MAG: ferritin [Candidatus Omnitrophica bacterium]|nr:ferritin [Candidatus Omnitrophota bacterium]
MLSEKMAKGLSRQMNREAFSAYLYMGMASYAASIGLSGFENWFVAQAKEELQHAKKFYDYLIKNGVRVIMEDIEKPPQEFSSGLDVFEKTFRHEKKVTSLIHDLVNLAKQERDTQTEKFLGWFVSEQKEEEATPARIIEDIKKAISGDEKSGYTAIDTELSRRKG